MTDRTSALVQSIRAAIPDAKVKIENLRIDDGYHYSVHVASSFFKGKSRVQQHQMVYTALKPHIDLELQAFSLITSEFEA